MSEREDPAEISLSVRNEEDVSTESSLAWADSCIVSFPEDSDDSNWGTFRDALTEIIDIHPDMFVPSLTSTSVPSSDQDMTEPESADMRNVELEAAGSAISDNIVSSGNEEVSEIVSLLTFESDPSKNSLQDRYFPLESTAEKGTTRRPVDGHTTHLEGGVECIQEDGSVTNGDHAEDDEPESSETSHVFKDDFMSRYIQDSVDDFDVPEDPVKVTPQEIFKVWDLDVVGDDDDEEDGLVLQLKKALHESSTVQPLNDDQLIVEKSFIDDLIAGISDLSLTETFE